MKNLSLHLVVLLLSILLLSGCMDSTEIQMVKGGHLGSCPSATVEEMVDGFLGSPSWDSGASDDGQSFVNIEGDFTIAGKEVRGVLQFIVDTNAGSFKFNAFEVNGAPQPNIMALGLLKKMCGSSGAEISAKVSEGLVADSAVPKMIAVEICQSDESITQLDNRMAGMDGTTTSEYIDDVQLSGSCAGGKIFVTLTTSTETGTAPFDIVLTGTDDGSGYRWSCSTTGDDQYVPEFCR